ncbi:MAG: hypothetical protein ABJF10_14075 [Chthoniobacter sp.]
MKFLLCAEPSSTGYKLTKHGEAWERQFVSIPQAFLYARSLSNSEGELVVLNSEGREVAHMRLSDVSL